MRALALSFLVMGLISQGACGEDRVGWIKREYREIRDNLGQYRKKTAELSGESAEGATATAYVDEGGRVRLIRSRYFGETGKVVYEFYYSNGHPFFILEQRYRYNTHIMMTQEKARERSKADGVQYEAFDPEKTKLHEWRYYLDDSKAVKVLDPGGNRVEKPARAAKVLRLSAENLAGFKKGLE